MSILRDKSEERKQGSNDEDSQGFGEHRFPSTVCPLFSSVYFSLTRLPLDHTSAVIWHLWGSGSRHFGDIIRTALIKHGQIVTFKDLGNNQSGLFRQLLSFSFFTHNFSIFSSLSKKHEPGLTIILLNRKKKATQLGMRVKKEISMKA